MLLNSHLIVEDLTTRAGALSGRVSSTRDLIGQLEGLLGSASVASTESKRAAHRRLIRARRDISDLISDVRSLTEIVGVVDRGHKLGSTVAKLRELNDLLTEQRRRIDALSGDHRRLDGSRIADGWRPPSRKRTALQETSHDKDLGTDGDSFERHVMHPALPGDTGIWVQNNQEDLAPIRTGAVETVDGGANVIPRDNGVDGELVELRQTNRLLARAVAHLADKLKPAAELVRSQLGYEVESFQAETVPLSSRLLNAHVRKTRIGFQADKNQRLIRDRMQLIDASRLFDSKFYASQLGSDGLQDMAALYHYLTHGWLLGLDPHPLFSVKYYFTRNADVLAAGIEPLSHYVEFGSKEMRDPHPLFLGSYYKATAGVAIPRDIPMLSHFLTEKNAGRPHPFFDASEYAVRAGLATDDVAFAIMHYASVGWQAGLDPSPLFKTKFYLSQFSQIEVGTLEPYTHYVLVGAAHELDPHPLFDTHHYLRSRPDISPYHVDPLAHYLLVGETEGASPSRFFDPSYYAARYGSQAGERGALWHYLSTGYTRGHDPHPDFNCARYRQIHDLPANGTTNPLEHFLLTALYGMGSSGYEGPSPSPATGYQTDPPTPVPAITRTPAKSERLRIPAASSYRAESALQKREYPGKRAAIAERPNLLVVAHIAGEYLFGSERSLLDILEGLERLPANMFVALPQNAPAYTNAVRQHAHKVFVFKYGWWKKDELPSAAVQRAFEALIVENKIDAVHCNTIMLREPLAAARSCNIPATVHARELIQHDRALLDIIGEPPARIIEAVKQRSDWIVANSQATADTFFKPNRTFVVPNTIDLTSMDMQNDVPGNEVRFGLISSNILKKGLLDVVELAREADKSCPNARFLLIGPETDLTRQIRQMQLCGETPKNIAFPGYASTPRDAIAQVNVVLNFSHFAESFGRTVLEAMAARRPVIAYRWGALPELIEHGGNGYLVPFRQPKQALPYVEALCKDGKLIDELGDRGRALVVQKYSPEQYATAFKTVYARILPRGDNAIPLVAPPDGRSGANMLRARDLDLSTKAVQPVRVAYFCWHFPVPSETFVLSELEALVKLGLDVIVFCRQSPHKGFTPPFQIRYERVDSCESLAKRLKETSRTIVHAHFAYPTVTEMVWPACEVARLPFTFIAHAQDIFRYENDKRNRLAEIGTSQWCRRLFVLSTFHSEFVIERGFPKEKVVINPNAVDVATFSAAWCDRREDRPFRRIVAVHRFVEKKGLSNLIRAAALIRDLGVTVDIYGYGELATEYKRLVEELSLDNVVINGSLTQQQVIEVMREADLFACPSIRARDGDMDGIPTSIVESMLAGLPVLTTAISGIPDLVCDEVTGFVAEPTPEGIAHAIRRFYHLPTLQVRTVINAAKERAKDRHDVQRLVRVLMRVWENRTADIVVVSWNNLTELKVVAERILANTALPYHLIICDNQSRREPVQDYLRDLWQRYGHVTIIFNDHNAMVGPGTNLALEQGQSDYAIYICGKEGISFAKGWELPFIHALEGDPLVGLVGSIGHSPTYLTGSQYASGIPLFSKFRNREFAERNPDRLFGHVQGGLFAIRRKMYAEIGGFSDLVPHDYTDVEYSFYAESCGWKLADTSNALALFNKSRPTLAQRFDESLVVAHPVLLNEIEQFDAVVRGVLKHCNVCNWFGEAFSADDLKCPACSAGRADRTLFRWLSESKYMYRRLPSLAVGLDGAMAQVWKQQFQGLRCSVPELLTILRRAERLPNKASSFHLAYIRCRLMKRDSLMMIARELKRVLIPGGRALIQVEELHCESADWQRFKDELCEALDKQVFAGPTEIVFTSRAVQLTWMPLLEFVRSASPEIL
jgi:glycosyltransferase involved in cell wall biosynthesis